HARRDLRRLDREHAAEPAALVARGVHELEARHRAQQALGDAERVLLGPARRARRPAVPGTRRAPDPLARAAELELAQAVAAREQRDAVRKARAHVDEPALAHQVLAQLEGALDDAPAGLVATHAEARVVAPHRRDAARRWTHD